MAVRRLPLRLPIASGESFTSYIDRVAAVLGRSPRDVINFIYPDPGDSLVIRHSYSHSIGLPEDRLKHVAHALNIGARDLLSTFLPTANSLLAGLPIDPHAVGRASLRRIYALPWVSFNTSLVCPRCLAEDEGAWSLSWRLRTSFCCVKHQAFLVFRCARCGEDPSQTAVATADLRAFVNRPLDPRKCRNRVPGRGRPGHAADPCAADLTALPMERLRAQRLLTAQAKVDAILESTQGAERLLPVARYALSFAVTDDLGPLPSLVAQAFETYIEGRERRRSETRVASYSTVTDTRVLGAALTYASGVVTSGEVTMRDSLEPLARRARQHGGAATATAATLANDLLQVIRTLPRRRPIPSRSSGT